jgi:C4-dicarboxylate-specific signal transduction histidine kinase
MSSLDDTKQDTLLKIRKPIKSYFSLRSPSNWWNFIIIFGLSVTIALLAGFVVGRFWAWPASNLIIGTLLGAVVGISIAWWRERRNVAEIERKLLEEQAIHEEINKLRYLGEMAAATAHQLNQPIGIIRATTDAALEDLGDNLLSPEDIESLLKRILAQTDRVAATIETFRKFGRGDRTAHEKVTLNTLVEQTTEIFAEQFNNRNIALQIELWAEHPPPMVWANPFQLEEVLINLLTNARDAVEGQKDAKVLVKTWRREGRGSGFSVEDNGPGLVPEYRQQMFVPFVSTKSTEQGSGLGLYISRRIIDDLGGNLRYQDQPDGGACFIVSFPPLKGR